MRRLSYHLIILTFVTITLLVLVQGVALASTYPTLRGTLEGMSNGTGGCAASPSQVSCDHSDPGNPVENCTNTSTLAQQPIVDSNGVIFGLLEVRYSPTCQSVWARVTNSYGQTTSLKAEIVREADDAVDASEEGGAADGYQMYSNMLFGTTGQAFFARGDGVITNDAAYASFVVTVPSSGNSLKYPTLRGTLEGTSNGTGGCAASPSQVSCDHSDPGNPVENCTNTSTLAQQPIVDSNGVTLGLLEVRYSPTCQSVWARVTSSYGQSSLRAEIIREADGNFDTAYAGPVAKGYQRYSNMLFGTTGQTFDAVGDANIPGPGYDLQATITVTIP